MINLHFGDVKIIDLAVLVLCWILINLHAETIADCYILVLVLCWILINLHHWCIYCAASNVLVLCWILINLHFLIIVLHWFIRFSTLLDIDKLTPKGIPHFNIERFSTLLDIDKLTHTKEQIAYQLVLVLCWILINLHLKCRERLNHMVLVLCWILINLHKLFM